MGGTIVGESTKHQDMHVNVSMPLNEADLSQGCPKTPWIPCRSCRQQRIGSCPEVLEAMSSLHLRVH